MTLTIDDFIAQRTGWGEFERHDLRLATKEVQRLGLVDWFKNLNIDDFRRSPPSVDIFRKKCDINVLNALRADSGFSYSMLRQSLHFYYATRDKDWVCSYPTSAWAT